MRRLAFAAAVAATAVSLAGCGSSGSGSSPQSTELSYLAKGSPFVLSLDTSPSGPLGTQLKSAEASNTKFSLIKAALFNKLADAGIDYNTEVKPLFGNPLVFGLATAQPSGGSPPFLLAWQTDSASALKKLVTADHATAAGTHDGATFYTEQGVALAVKGALLLAADTTGELTQALDRHASGQGVGASDYASATHGLPNGAVTIAGDLAGVLGTAKAAQARKVPWVAAIKSYGVSLSLAKSTVALSFRIDTSGRTLNASQLPIAAGSTAPSLTGGAAITAGLRDPAQFWDFVLAAEQAANPTGFARLTRKEQSTQRRSGVNIEQFLASLTGGLQFSSDGRSLVARTAASASTAAMWTKLLAHPGYGTDSSPIGGGFYRLTQSDGTTLYGGVAHGELLLGKASPDALRAYASAAASPASTAGALAFKVAPSLLASLAHKQGAALAVGAVLGDIVGSVQATPQALTGSASVTVPLAGSAG